MAKINKKKFMNALEDSDGNITIIAKRIGVSRQAVYDYIKKRNLKEELEEEKQNTIEEVKNRRREFALHGSSKFSNTWNAIKSILTKSGDHAERQEIQHSGDGLKIIIEKADNANSKMETNSKAGKGVRDSKRQ